MFLFKNISQKNLLLFKVVTLIFIIILVVNNLFMINLSDKSRLESRKVVISKIEKRYFTKGIGYSTKIFDFKKNQYRLLLKFTDCANIKKLNSLSKGDTIELTFTKYIDFSSYFSDYYVILSLDWDNQKILNSKCIQQNYNHSNSRLLFVFILVDLGLLYILKLKSTRDR